MKIFLCITLTFAIILSGCSSKDNINVTNPRNSTQSPTSRDKSQTGIIPVPESSPLPQDNKGRNSDIINRIAADLGVNNTAKPLQLDMDSCYVIPTGLWSGVNNTITILDHKGKVVRSFYNAAGNILNYGKADKNTPIIIGLSTYEKPDPEKWKGNIKYGLYLPAADRFIIEPKYDSIREYGDNLYGGTVDNLVTVFDRDGKVCFTQKPEENYYLEAVGNYLWYLPYSGGNAYIYDRDFTKVAEIDQTLGMCYPYGNYVLLEYYFYESDNTEGIRSVELLTDEGNVYISKDILISRGSLPDVEGTISSIDCFDDTDLYRITYGQYELLLDKDFNRIDTINAAEEPNSFFALEYGTYYKYTDNMQNSDAVIFNSKGRAIKDDKGKTFTNTLGTDEVYRIEDSKITIYNYLTGSRCEFTLQGYTAPTVFSPFRDLYLIRNDKEPFQLNAFYKDKLIFSGDNYLWSYPYYGTANNEFQIIYPDKSSGSYEISAINTIINKEGEIVYTSPYEETIYSVDENYVLVKRGNYIGLVDFNGNFVYKMIDPSLGND